MSNSPKTPRSATTLRTASVKGSPHPFSPLEDAIPTIPPSLAWRRAVDRYSQDNGLTVEEQKILRVKSPTDFSSDLRTVEMTHLQRSRIQKAMNKLQGFLDLFTRFEQAIESFANADPWGVLSLLWGSVRMCLIVLKDFSELYEVLVEFFIKIQDDVGRLTAYEVLFGESKRFNLALCAVFESLLDFCSWFRMKTRSRGKFVAKMVFVGSLKKEAALKISHFHALCIKTESEAQLAGAESSVKFQETAIKLLKDVKGAQVSSVTALAKDSLKSLHEKLSPTPTAEHLETLLRKRFQGTCSWILSSQQFAFLASSGKHEIEHQLTWITGVPGCGKSYLSAYMVERLQEKYPVGYFFCDTKDVATQSLSNILRTWAWQLCYSTSDLASEVLQAISSSVEITQKLLTDLLAIVLKSQPAFLLLDGLDECEGDSRIEILNAIGIFARSAHVIIVSRKERDIELKIRELEEDAHIPVSHVQIKPADTAEDIKRYLVKEIGKCNISDPILVTRIVAEVGTRANGMFLYARLILNELHQSDTDEECREVLEHLPKTIEQVYGRALNRINSLKPARKARVIRLLQYIMYATRPTTLAELSIALAIVPGEYYFRPGNVPNISKLFLECCTSLLELDEESETLICIHATAKEYLMYFSNEEQLTDPVTAHANIASVCITYLNYEDRGFVDRSEVDVTAIPYSEPWPWFDYLHSPFHLHLEEHPLIQYSAANWPIHISRLAGEVSIQKSIEQCLAALHNLLSSEEKLLRWLEIFHFLVTEGVDVARDAANLIDSWILQYEDAKLSATTIATPVKQHALATFAFSFNGFPRIDTSEADQMRKASTIYPSAAIVARLEPSWSFALDHLGFSGLYGIYRWRRFIQIEPITRKPVHMAAFFDFTDFIAKEIASGLDVNDRCATDRSIINKAAFGESTNACKLLLELGADIDQCPDFTFFDGNRPIMHALFDDQFVPLRPRDYSTAKFLLEAGAKVQVDANPLHPLHTIFDFWTETDAQMDILKTILDRAEDVVSLLETASPYSAMTPLQIVVRNNLPETARNFLERHPDPRRYASMAWGADGKNALHEACFARNSLCGPLLIDTGMDVNTECAISGSTPLHIATTAHSNMLDVLLAKSANANCVDGAGRLPLHLAAMQDWAEAVTKLVPQTEDINAKDSDGHTALQLAYVHSSRSAAKALILAGASQTNDRSATGLVDRYYPATTSEAYHTYFLLSSLFNFRASKELLLTIVDNAEYWLRSTSSLAQPFAVQQADSGRPYLISKPLSMPGSAIRKLRVRISGEATEGELTALFPERRSWTWFTVSSYTAKTGALTSGRRLAENDINLEGRQEHDCVTYSTDKGNDVANWLAKLRRLDSIALVPMARWPQRINTVYEASIEISSSVLKQPATGADETVQLITDWGNWRI